MTGKEKCAVLREIRKLIAYANDISYKFEECDFDGPCKGYCEKCDKEIEYIQEAMNNLKNCETVASSSFFKEKFIFEGNSSLSLSEN